MYVIAVHLNKGGELRQKKAVILGTRLIKTLTFLKGKGQWILQRSVGTAKVSGYCKGQWVLHLLLCF